MPLFGLQCAIVVFPGPTHLHVYIMKNVFPRNSLFYEFNSRDVHKASDGLLCNIPLDKKV